MTEEKPTYRIENYDTALSDKAAARIERLALSGGYAPKDIKRSDITSNTYLVDAITLISFKNILQPEQKKPKREIKVSEISSFEEAAALSAQKIDKMSKNSSFQASMRRLFTSEQNLGFGMPYKDVRIAALSDHYVVKEPCKACGGECQHICQNCQGRKQDICHTCGGQKSKICVDCGGRGQIPSQQNPSQYETCPVCNGQQSLPCRSCSATGIMVCATCGGRGQVGCKDCGGHGSITQYGFAQTFAETSDILNQQDMPENVKTVINKIGLHKLLKGRHVTLRQTQGDPNTYFSDEEIEGMKDYDKYAYHFPPRLGQDQMYLYYQLKIPYAELSIHIGNEEITAKLLGNKGIIADMPPFLNNVVSRETTELKKKINSLTKENIDNHLSLPLMKKSWKFMQSMRTKKAIAAFAKEYGAAIDKKEIHALFKTLKHIRNNLTRNKRYILYGIVGLSILTLGFIILKFL